jgi:glucokinase
MNLLPQAITPVTAVNLPGSGDTSGAPLQQPWLVADIGGTNARFGWVAAGSREVTLVRTLSVADHASPAQAARTYLTQLTAELGAALAVPRAAAFAVATAVGSDPIAFTNSGWSFSRAATQAELGLDALLMLNDFEALALSLPRLGAAQVRAIPGSRLQTAGQPSSALAVIGPGTGLGVAGLLPTRHGWMAIPGEGGHATLAAGDDFEAAILAAVRREHPHVSAERLLSGIGLPVLHTATAQVLGQSGPPLSAGAIVERALDGSDATCSRAIDAFCALLGSFAGNVALTLGARGGVYIGGGIVPRLGETFFASRFRERFEAKGRFQSYLQAVPTLLITDTLAALGGATLALEQHGR